MVAVAVALAFSIRRLVDQILDTVAVFLSWWSVLRVGLLLEQWKEGKYGDRQFQTCFGRTPMLVPVTGSLGRNLSSPISTSETFVNGMKPESVSRVR